MNNTVGIYRGSFDPPHNGHLEAVTCALQNGISPITIIYEDPNRHKPFRSSNEVRRDFLMAMFANMPNVTISQKKYRVALSDLLADPTISKIYQIIGSDLLSLPVRPIKSPANLAYFIHDRGDVSLGGVEMWNGLPVKIAYVNRETESPSSTMIRNSLQNREFQKVQPFFPIEVFEKLISGNVYVPTVNEYPYRHILQVVKKTIEKEIVAQKLVSEENYPLSFQLGKDIGVSGFSGDLVCFISDHNRQMRLVVKIFLGETCFKNYESERLGYRILSDLHLKHIKVPKLFVSESKSDFAFICMDYAGGKSLADLMDQSEEAICLCAKANLELHMVQRALVDVDLEQIAHFEKILPKVIGKLNGDCLLEDVVPRLSERWEGLREAFIANPGKRSFTHGDPNHTNWLVDLENQQVTYIDLSLFSRSVLHSETPCGFAINELEESLLTFKIAAKLRGLSNEKTEAIQKLYYKAYMKEAPSDVTTKEAREYFAAYWNLRVIENIIDKHASSQSDEAKMKYQQQLQNHIQIFLKPINKDIL